MANTVWFCPACCELKERNQHSEETKLFLRYVADMVRTVKGNPGELLKLANQLHLNLQLLWKKANDKGKLVFLHININVNTCKKLICGCYQKPTDTGTIFTLRRCSPLHHKKNIIEGAIR